MASLQPSPAGRKNRRQDASRIGVASHLSSRVLSREAGRSRQHMTRDSNLQRVTRGNRPPHASKSNSRRHVSSNRGHNAGSIPLKLSSRNKISSVAMSSSAARRKNRRITAAQSGRKEAMDKTVAKDKGTTKKRGGAGNGPAGPRE